MTFQTTEFTEVDMVAGTATSTAGAATVNAQSGIITTESLTTLGGATYTMTLTNSEITANSIVYATIGKGTATTGSPVVSYITAGAGTAVILVTNASSSVALNGTIKIGFTAFNI